MSNWGDFAESVEEESAIERLRAANNRLSRELYDVKHRQADYIQAVRDAVTAAMSSIVIPPVPAPKRKRAGKGPTEVAVALLSDMQTGKVTPDYNSDVCRERVMRYAEKIVAITQVQRADHPVKHCVIPLLGDVIEGCDIFPGQAFRIDSTLYRQVFDTTPTILVDFIRYLLANFDTVTVEAVQGNHGRIGRRGQFGPEDNADRMVYRLVQLLLKGEPRFTMRMADPVGEAAWYQVMEIGTYRAMLIHGDQIRGAMGFPWYGVGKKAHSWASGGIPEGFTDLMMGHYHQLASIPLNKRRVWANGSTESNNTFAAETLAAQSDPSQWLLYVSPSRGYVTASYEVRLKEDS